MGGGTVEEGGGVDAGPWDGAYEVPHLVKGDTLGYADDDADDDENGEEVDGPFAEALELFVNG